MIGMALSLNYVARLGADRLDLGRQSWENSGFVDFRLLRFLRSRSLPGVGIGLPRVVAETLPDVAPLGRGLQSDRVGTRRCWALEGGRGM